MALLGPAAIAMWWDVAPEWRAEFEEWHSREHFPERLRIPGFLRGSRWGTAGGSFFVLYEVDAYETLTSAHYLARLNAPTPWSTKLMPHHRNMVRSLCRVTVSFGGGIARSILTVRLSPREGAGEALLARLRDRLSSFPVPVTGAHLLQTETPAHATTKEQKIRGGDASADWIVLVGAYETEALGELARTSLSPAVLAALGAQDGARVGVYELCYAAAREDMNPGGDASPYTSGRQ
jgi:hypothetical protein